jgi:hypothetical protein
MNREIQLKWQAALRSGQFKQGFRQLTQVRSGQQEHCCLGVLCQLYLSEGNELAVTEENSVVRYNSEGGYLPLAVADWADLDHSTQLKLADLNDGVWGNSPKTFDEIADIIGEL